MHSHTSYNYFPSAHLNSYWPVAGLHSVLGDRSAHSHSTLRLIQIRDIKIEHV